jgi:hypothetical protein
LLQEDCFMVLQQSYNLLKDAEMQCLNLKNDHRSPETFCEEGTRQ